MNRIDKPLAIYERETGCVCGLPCAEVLKTLEQHCQIDIIISAYH